MTDTARTLAQIKTLLGDNNTGQISPQDMRDVVESIVDPVPGGLAEHPASFYTANAFSVYRYKPSGLKDENGVVHNVASGESFYPSLTNVVAGEFRIAVGQLDWILPNPSDEAVDIWGDPNLTVLREGVTLFLPPGSYTVHSQMSYLKNGATTTSITSYTDYATYGLYEPGSIAFATPIMEVEQPVLGGANAIIYSFTKLYVDDPDGLEFLPYNSVTFTGGSGVVTPYGMQFTVMKDR